MAAPAPAPAVEEESKSLGAKAKAGLHHMMDGLSAGKAKLECKILKSCPASELNGGRTRTCIQMVDR